MACCHIYGRTYLILFASVNLFLSGQWYVDSAYSFAYNDVMYENINAKLYANEVTPRSLDS